MKRGNVHQEEEEEEEEEFVSKKVPSTNNKDGESNDKASATRSKHSVTEQRRRSKINERFQILRDLIPHSDQKRDTASFLLEVIEYVQYLQEKVQKYEGSSYQGWSPEPTKLMPWRNSHWRLQSFGGPPQSIKNDSGPSSTFAGCFGDNDVTVSHTMLANQQNESLPAPIQSGGVLPHPLHRPNSDAQSTESPITSDAVNQQEELMVEGGTISIKSAYTQGLLNSLTQALQSAGVDLSQASVSVQIDLGKRANREPSYGTSIPKNPENTSGHQPIGHSRDASNGSELDQAQKRPKI